MSQACSKTGGVVLAESPGIGGPRTRLYDFLREYRHEITADWLRRARLLSPARELSDKAILDELPELLIRMADVVESAHSGSPVSLGDLPQQHALDRLGRGFDFDLIVTEYSLLRRSLLDLWESRIGSTVDIAELRSLDTAFDQAIASSAHRYAKTREKLLKALDRVSEAALGSADLEAFLQDLLRATLEGTESVDTCVVLLREGDVFRVRAAVGLEEELRREYSLKLGEGFAGHVAEEGRPVALRDAAMDPIVKSPLGWAKGVRALYGVPMTLEGKVIGVAHIGSVTAAEFSEEDKLLFRTVVSRATSGVVKAQILADLRRAETAQRFLAEASTQLATSLDYEATIEKIAHLAVPTIADWCVVDLVDGERIRRVSVAHADPDKQQLARSLEQRYPIDPRSASGIPRVLRTGVSEWSAEITDSHMAAVARDPDHERMLHQLGLRSYIIAPIPLREATVGTIALVTAESGRHYSEFDLQVAEDLGRRVGVAIENARLYSEAQQAIAVRERVLAVVSHDLRNQLNVIAMGADLFSQKAASILSEDLKKPLETIRRTSRRMQSLLEDLLDMASIQAGRISFERERIDIRTVLTEACETHEPLARAKGLRLEAAFDIGHVVVLADRRRILQVLGNLLSNAIKFSTDGTVSLGASAHDTEVVIAVKDNGPGIPSPELAFIFEPYRTIQREGQTGTGLGLYIAKAIVARHGGRMWVETEIGQGATFFFSLPRVTQDDAAPSS